MFGKKKVQTYKSKEYDLTNTKDFNEFYGMVDTINDFDFAIDQASIFYTNEYQNAQLVVDTSEKVMEIWLIKHQFVEA